jgi:hypothetical protein
MFKSLKRKTFMRMFFVFLCNIALACVVAAGQHGKTKEQPRKKTVSGGQTSQPAPPAGKAVGKRAGSGGSTTEPGKTKGVGKTGEVGKTTGPGKTKGAEKTGEGGKTRGPGKTKGANKTAKDDKPKTSYYKLPGEPNPDVAPPVDFQQNRRIDGSQNWQGSNYAAFREYSSEWHDKDWWDSRYRPIRLISGGWYYWNAGFWYPAWGYDPANSYYPYDGPIPGYNDLPPDQVIANVQSALQQQGYYHGGVDGSLGPLTRAAIADYQRDHGLNITSAVDQPTLESLGME